MITVSQKAIKRARAKAVIQELFGWPVAILFGLVFFIDLGTGTDIPSLLILMAFTALGVWLICLGFRKIKLIRLLPSYTERLKADPEKSIDRLAATAGVSVKTAARNIRRMIALGFLPGCFFDQQSNRVVSNASPAQAAAVDPVKYVTVTCKSCGAENKIPEGGSGECEYCGSPLSE